MNITDSSQDAIVTGAHGACAIAPRPARASRHLLPERRRYVGQTSLD